MDYFGMNSTHRHITRAYNPNEFLRTTFFVVVDDFFRIDVFDFALFFELLHCGAFLLHVVVLLTMTTHNN